MPDTCILDDGGGLAEAAGFANSGGAPGIEDGSAVLRME
jgi:hypothetical protein